MTDPKTQTPTPESDDSAPDYPPAVIEVWFSLDAEPEIKAIGIAPWLVAQTLYRAADILLADQDVAEGDEEEEGEQV